MTTAYAELSAGGWYELQNDLATLGHKTALGWMRMVARLKQRGSIPGDERSIAEILGVTVRFMRERAWPQIEDRLVKVEGAERYYCPEISGGRPIAGRRDVAQAPAPAARAKNSQQQAAARARWEKAGARRASSEPETHAETHTDPHAERMQAHAETHDFSMPDAFENASDPHAVASASGRPDSLSLKESSENLALEREDGGTSAHAANMRFDAPADAPSDAAPDATRIETHAPADATRKRRGSTRTALADDWKPTEEAAVHAEEIGADLAAEVRKFRHTARSRETISADWDASFLLWLERGVEYQRQRNIPLVRSLEGDKPAAPSPELAEDTAPEALRLRRVFGDAHYRTWFRELVIGKIDQDREITVTVPGVFRRDYIRQNYANQLFTLLREDEPGLVRVNIEAAPMIDLQQAGA